MCLGVRLTRQPVFGEVFLGSRHVYNRILQRLLVRLPFFLRVLEGTLRICEGGPRLLELLFSIP
jgi:hypothetical protein